MGKFVIGGVGKFGTYQLIQAGQGFRGVGYWEYCPWHAGERGSKLIDEVAGSALIISQNIRL